MDFFNIFCLTIFLFICYLIINLSQIEDKFILVINDDDEELVKATNYNSVKKTTAEKNDDINILQEQIYDKELKTTNYSSVKEAIANSVKEKNHEIEQIRKESLLFRQEIYKWCQIFESESDIEIIESKIKDLDKFIHKQNEELDDSRNHEIDANRLDT
ncbi:36033_t:CDS:2 [Gigaspora margarita]|uniref:36033_t:CDS:1 n=1 Tax=Gigaspora margarita TaxID=4874 RepID=A0ABN7UVF2_GIGMA|nr:36033_t:CDS:2 [Gigaspora margarita]